jgi:hypothetical protein
LKKSGFTVFFSFPITFYIVNNNLSSKLEMDGKNIGEFDKNSLWNGVTLDGKAMGEGCEKPPAKAGGGFLFEKRTILVCSSASAEAQVIDCELQS